MLTDKTVKEFINELASSSPAPGGGSVASLAGALGAALTSMVCNLTIGKKKYADVQETIQTLLAQSEELRASLTALIDDDSNAFNDVMRAFGLPKETDEQKALRGAAIENATKSATLIPLNVMRLCERSLLLTRVVAEKGNSNSLSDAGVAALMINAACAGARLNVQINLGSLRDAGFVQEMSAQAHEISGRVEVLSRDILHRINSQLSIKS